MLVVLHIRNRFLELVTVNTIIYILFHSGASSECKVDKAAGNSFDIWTSTLGFVKENQVKL